MSAIYDCLSESPGDCALQVITAVMLFSLGDWEVELQFNRGEHKKVVPGIILIIIMMTIIR